MVTFNWLVPALLGNVRVVFKGLPVTDTLAYFGVALMMWQSVL